MAGKSLTVALTGGTGFVGRHVLPKLLAEGHEVRALVRDQARWDTIDKRVHRIEGDLFDDEAVHELVEGVDAVVHLVGIIMEKPKQGQTFERVHVESTRRLIEATRAAAAHRQSQGRGGAVKWAHMSALGSRPNAVSMYHRTKWQAEELVRGSGLDYTIFRPSIIHGPDGEFMQMVRGFWCGFFPPFIVPYFGAGPLGTGGAGRLQPVYVDDVATCFTSALTNPKASGETYPLGGPLAVTWPQLYEAVGRHLANKRNKRVFPVPAWYAKIIAGKPGVPFNLDQVIMSQEDSTCEIAKVESDFGIKLADFEATVAQYAGSIQA